MTTRPTMRWRCAGRTNHTTSRKVKSYTSNNPRGWPGRRERTSSVRRWERLDRHTKPPREEVFVSLGAERECLGMIMRFINIIVFR